MSRGPESEAPLQLRHTDAVQLLEDIAERGQHFALVALPESAESFVADMTWLDWPVALAYSDIELLRQQIRLFYRELADTVDSVDLMPALAVRPLQRHAEEAYGPRMLEQAIQLFVQLHASPAADEIAVPSDPADAGDDGWGPLVPAAEAEALERQNLRLQVEQRREQLANSFTRSEAAALLGVSPQTVSDMVAERRLVGLKDGRAWKLPAWQFTPDLEEPVLPEIGRLAQEFPGGVVSLSRWMSRPNDNFTGRTPAQEMIHDTDRVFAVVGSLTAA